MAARICRPGRYGPPFCVALRTVTVLNATENRVLAVECVAAGVAEPLDLLSHVADVALVAAARAAEVTGVHTLEDARQLPVPEGHIEVELAQVSSRTLGVPVAQ